MTNTSLNPDARTWQVLRAVGWTAAVLILLAPLVAMGFTDEVDWTLRDFLFAAILIGGAGLFFEVVLRHSTDTSYRTGALVAIASSFLLLWTNAAVGFIGSGINFANVLYFAMPIVPLIGGFTSAFRAHGLFRALLSTAFVQVAVTIFVIATGAVDVESYDIIIVANTLFLLLWIASAVLFHQAAVRETSATSGDAPRMPVSEVQFVLSFLLFALGAVMITYTIITEHAPGALPSLVTISGLLWVGWTVYHGRKERAGKR